MRFMTLPSGKLLLAAALLLCTALAQTPRPALDQPSAQSAPSVRPVAHVPLTVHLGKRGKSPTRDRQGNSKPVPWDLSTHGAKALYLTFDDGPHPIYTPMVLSILAKHHAKATFFVLGREVAAHPQLVDLERSYGHHIGNHTWDHPMLTQLTDARIRQEISTGVKSRCFRPPYRDTNQKVEAIAASYHFHQILWDVDTNDWKKPGEAAIERAILRGAHPGAIILMHDGGGNRTETIAALDRALTKLAAQGYSFRSLPC
jgi:peptidoglycan/xylan/chitin deacetylase (PgdA/CDA1 family)